MSEHASGRASVSLALITATAALLLLAAMLWRLPPSDPYGPYAFGGSICIFVARSSRRRLFAALVASPFLMLAFRAIHTEASSALVSATIAVGAATILVSIVGTARSLDRDAAVKELAAMVAMPAFVLTAAAALHETSNRQPLTYDMILAAVDRGFGVDASAMAARALARSTTAYWICKIVYDSLPLALCVATAARYRQVGSRDEERLIWKMILAASCALILFSIVPACGPRFFWGDKFPLATAAVGLPLRPVLVSPADYRNALPSLHLTGALFVAWASRPFNAGIRLLAWAYVAVTVVATLGSGQHYLIDLVVAVPFAGAIDLAVRREQRASAAMGLVIVGVWIALIRWAGEWLASTPSFTLAFAVISVATPFLHPWRLGQRGGQEPLFAPVTTGRTSAYANLSE